MFDMEELIALAKFENIDDYKFTKLLEKLKEKHIIVKATDIVEGELFKENLSFF